MTQCFLIRTPVAEQHLLSTKQIVRVTSTAEVETIITELIGLGLVHITNSSVPNVHEFRLQESLKCNFCGHLWWGKYAALLDSRFLPEACAQCGKRFRYNYALVRIWEGQHYYVQGKDESAPLGTSDLEEEPLPVPRRVRVYCQTEPLSDEQLVGAALGLAQ